MALVRSASIPSHCCLVDVDGPPDTAASRWTRTLESRGNLHDAAAATAEGYRRDIHCEFGNADADTSGEYNLYLVIDVIVL